MTEISSEPREASREVQVASLGMRALGAIGDFVILCVIAVPFGLVFGTPPEQGVDFSLQGYAAGAAYAVGFLYFIVTEALWGGTPAKMLLDMRVVREMDGGKIGWGESIIRNVLRVVDVFPVLYLVGFFFAVSSPKTQRLGDRIARTVVIRK
jgi:uncharacterized RDD family membrane protein YckC